jgi:RimJ/RimL family protein N-acetyltransferase
MIKTNRLLLRPHRLEDFERYVPLWDAAEMRRQEPNMALSAEEAWARLLRFIGHWQCFGYGLFVVEALGSGELIGELGCAQFKRHLGDERFDTVPEAGWRVVSSRRRQGIAIEAMQAVLQWLEQTMCATRTVCMIHPDNVASLAVAARLGYREYRRAAYKDRAIVLLERNGGSPQ